MARSPFRRVHQDATRLSEAAQQLTSAAHTSLLHGQRAFGWPTLALRTSFTLGPVRHALSQMVVAGTMTVFPPFVPNKPPPKGDGPDDTSS